MNLHDREVTITMAASSFNDFQMNAYRRGVGQLVAQLTEIMEGRLPVGSFQLEDHGLPEDTKGQLRKLLVALANLNRTPSAPVAHTSHVKI